MSQSQKPPPPKYKVMYTKDASVRSVKNSPVHKIVLLGLCQNYSPIWFCEQINTFSYTHICLLLNYSSLQTCRNSFPSYEDIKIHDVLFTSHNTPHITLSNEQCLKLLLGVSNTKKRGDLSLSLVLVQTPCMHSVEIQCIVLSNKKDVK
jgi:hypothetical protein